MRNACVKKQSGMHLLRIEMRNVHIMQIFKILSKHIELSIKKLKKPFETDKDSLFGCQDIIKLG